MNGDDYDDELFPEDEKETEEERADEEARAYRQNNVRQIVRERFRQREKGPSLNKTKVREMTVNPEIAQKLADKHVREVNVESRDESQKKIASGDLEEARRLLKTKIEQLHDNINSGNLKEAKRLLMENEVKEDIKKSGAKELLGLLETNKNMSEKDKGELIVSLKEISSDNGKAILKEYWKENFKCDEGRHWDELFYNSSPYLKLAEAIGLAGKNSLGKSSIGKPKFPQKSQGEALQKVDFLIRQLKEEGPRNKKARKEAKMKLESILDNSPNDEDINKIKSFLEERMLNKKGLGAWNPFSKTKALLDRVKELQPSKSQDDPNAKSVNQIIMNIKRMALEREEVSNLSDALSREHGMDFSKDTMLQTIILNLQNGDLGIRNKAIDALEDRVKTTIPNILRRLEGKNEENQNEAIEDLAYRVSDHLANRVNERASMMGCRFLTPSEIRQINGALSKLKRRDLNSLKREVLVDVEKIDHEQKKLLAKVEKLKLGKPKAKTESFLDKAMKWRNMTQRFKSHWARRSNNENGPNKTKQ